MSSRDFEIEGDDDDDDDIDNGSDAQQEEEEAFDFAAAQRRRQLLQSQLEAFTDGDNDDAIENNEDEDERDKGVDRALSEYAYFASKYGVSRPASAASSIVASPRFHDHEIDDSQSGRDAHNERETLRERDTHTGRESHNDNDNDDNMDDNNEDLSPRGDLLIDAEEQTEHTPIAIASSSVNIAALIETKREELEQINAVAHLVEENKSLSDRFRAELESFLTLSENKLDSEGRPLVVVPKNFDAVVSAMTREDLFDEPNNAQEQEQDSAEAAGAARTVNKRHDAHKHEPWYHYLLSDQIDQAMDREFGGRYHALLNGERQGDRVKKGLAEILMLDRQLYLLTKKSAELDTANGTTKEKNKGRRKKTNDEEEDDGRQRSSRSARSSNGANREQEGGDPDDDDDDVSETSSRTSSRATHRDKTFLTKQPSTHSAASTPRSARLAATNKKKASRDVLDAVHTQAKTQQRQEGQDLDEEDEEDEMYRKEGHGSRITAFNLTAEHRERTQRLVEMADEEWEQDAQYIPAELIEEDRRITQEIERFGRADRLQIEEITKKSVEQEKKMDFLALQRKERKAKEHEKNVDQMLNTCTSKLDYTALFLDSDEEAQSKKKQSRSKLRCPLHEVPPIDEVRPDLPIRRSDIRRLIEGLIESNSFSPCPDSAESATPRGEQKQPEAELHLKSLLSSLRAEIANIDYLRQKQREQQQGNDFRTVNGHDSDNEGEQSITEKDSDPFASFPASISSVIKKELDPKTMKTTVASPPLTERKGSKQSRLPRRSNVSRREQATMGPEVCAEERAREIPITQDESTESGDPPREGLKVFDSADLQMLKHLLQKEAEQRTAPLITLPRIPSATDPQGKRSSLNPQYGAPILPSSRRSKPRSRPSSTKSRTDGGEREEEDFVEEVMLMGEDPMWEGDERDSLVDQIRRFVEC